MEEQKKGNRSILKVALIGCGTLSVLGLGLIVWLGVWIFSGPEGGVKLGNEMDQYAVDYLDQHGLLEAGEEVLAYYDATLSMNGSQAAIVTNARVLYHKDPVTTAIPLEEVTNIRHRYESLVGDVFEIESVTGKMMKIEIAPLNQGKTFKNVLMSAWRRAKRTSPDEHSSSAIE